VQKLGHDTSLARELAVVGRGIDSRHPDRDPCTGDGQSPEPDHSAGRRGPRGDRGAACPTAKTEIYTTGKTILRVVTVPGKMVNIVTN
jgi:hypothetical protein